MSEEKMYAVKNDEGKYWDFEDPDGFWEYLSDRPVTTSNEQAEQAADEHGGHVVTFVEEPEKVVLTKAQAKIVKEARGFYLPATLISQKSGNEEEEELLMRAYVNGYTVASEKKYLVYKKLGGKHTADVQYAQAYLTSVHSKILWILTSWILTSEDTDESLFQFTEAEIEHYGLQDCEKEEVADDEQ